MQNPIVQALQAGDYAHFSGTDLAVSLPVQEAFLNEWLRGLQDGPLTKAEVRLLSGNRAILAVEIDAPIVGRTERELALRIQGDLQDGVRDWIHFHIEDGWKLLDKPLINLAQGMIEARLPAGVEINAQRISIHLARLVEMLGYDYLIPLLAAARLESEPKQLIFQLHFKVD